MAQEKANDVAYIVIKDDADFDKKLTENKDKLIVIDFSASWCGPCHAVAPKVKEFAKQYAGDNVVVFNVDVDVCTETSEKFGIQAMPTFKFLKAGKEVDEVVGANADAVEKKIQELK